MAEADTELISPHIHIKNASMCGKVLTENQLETGKRSPIYPSCKKDGRQEKGKTDYEMVGWHH